MRRLLTTAIAAAFVLAGLAAPGVASAAGGSGIVAKLKHLPGVTFLGTNPNAPTGYTIYELEIRQPVNHKKPHGATFEQHLELYQRNVTAPMVMYVSGYFNYTFLGPQNTYLSTPAALTGANQISVEHRFYGDSVPHPTLWRYLTIWQQSADEHHVEQVFKKLYHSPWLITGVSKGGETAIFHDYFYPHDFSGTFAWSAPSITETPSHSYDHFMASVGTAKCRAALLAAQVRAFRHRATFEAMITAQASAAHETFSDWKSGLDEDFEVTVLQTPFVFWQYGGDCATVPGGKASLQALYQWYDTTVGWLAADDQQSAPFFSYNYQAGTQLGYPVIDERAKLGSLLHFPLSAQVPQEDLPPGVPVRPLSQHLMRAIHQWVAAHGNNLLFLYGQFDPWSSQRFTLGSGTHGSAIYIIKGGNHLSPYTDLPAAQAQAFVKALRTWAGLSPSENSSKSTGPAYAPPSRLQVRPASLVP
jgi:hypothetical protein